MFMMTYEVRVWAVRLETWLAAAAAPLTLASLRRDTSRHVSSGLDIQHHLHLTTTLQNLALTVQGGFLSEDGRN